MTTTEVIDKLPKIKGQSKTKYFDLHKEFENMPEGKVLKIKCESKKESVIIWHSFDHLKNRKNIPLEVFRDTVDFIVYVRKPITQ